MGDNIQSYCNFLTTSDVMKILGIGNKACLELFHRKDFPCEKIGRAFKISEERIERLLTGHSLTLVIPLTPARDEHRSLP